MEPGLEEKLLALGRRIAALEIQHERRALLALYGQLASACRPKEAAVAEKMKRIACSRIVRRGRVAVRKRASPKRSLAWAVAQQVKLARSRKGWRQEDLAKRTGIARPNIARLEAGRHVPKLPTLSLVADALAIDLKSLVALPKPGYAGPDSRLGEQGLRDWDRQLKKLEKGR